jgi:hypothetical protein
MRPGSSYENSQGNKRQMMPKENQYEQKTFQPNYGQQQKQPFNKSNQPRNPKYQDRNNYQETNEQNYRPRNTNTNNNNSNMHGQASSRPNNQDSENRARTNEQNNPPRNVEALPQRQGNQRGQRKNQNYERERENEADNFREERPDAANYRNPEGTATAPKTDEEIKRDRRWKNDNKAKVVHHNRKDLAAKKMNRGFF